MDGLESALPRLSSALRARICPHLSLSGLAPSVSCHSPSPPPPPLPISLLPPSHSLILFLPLPCLPFRLHSPSSPRRPVVTLYSSSSSFLSPAGSFSEISLCQDRSATRSRAFPYAVK